jgi:hypothetical protein
VNEESVKWRTFFLLKQRDCLAKRNHLRYRYPEEFLSTVDPVLPKEKMQPAFGDSAVVDWQAVLNVKRPWYRCAPA